MGGRDIEGSVNLRSMRVLDPKRLIKRNEGGVEKVKALGANGEVSGSRVRVVWMVVDGRNVRKASVQRDCKEMSMKSVRGIFFGGFWVEELALDAMEYDDQDKMNEEDDLQDRTRISAFIIRIGGVGVEIIGMVQGQQCVRNRKVFSITLYNFIPKSKVSQKFTFADSEGILSCSTNGDITDDFIWCRNGILIRIHLFKESI
nr:hypothetical protein [Tanacetum cinerariifolium]